MGADGNVGWWEFMAMELRWSGLEDDSLKSMGGKRSDNELPFRRPVAAVSSAFSPGSS